MIGEFLKYWNYLDKLDWWLIAISFILLISWYYKHTNYLIIGIKKYRYTKVIFWCYIIFIPLLTWFFGFSISLGQCGLWNERIWYEYHIRFQMAGLVAVVISSYKLYEQFGGMGLIDIGEFFRVLFLCIKQKDFRKLRNEKYKLFSDVRLARAAAGYKNFDDIIDIALNLIDLVTSKLKIYVNRQKNWLVFTSRESESFLGDIGNITRSKYSLIEHIGLSEKDLSVFYNVLDSMTPNFDRRLKEILEDYTYTEFQRRDSVLKMLYMFGQELKDEIINIRSVMKEHKQFKNGD